MERPCGRDRKMIVRRAGASVGGIIASKMRKIAALVWDRLMSLLNGYRPEKYYMRGPGPKCRQRE
jgi:hypothetical protein